MFTSIFQWYFGGNHLMMRRRWWHSGLRVEEKRFLVSKFNDSIILLVRLKLKCPNVTQIKHHDLPPENCQNMAWYTAFLGKKIHLLQTDLTILFLLHPHLCLKIPHDLGPWFIAWHPLSLYQIPGLCCLSHLNSWFLWLRHASTPHVCCSRLFRYS